MYHTKIDKGKANVNSELKQKKLLLEYPVEKWTAVEEYSSPLKGAEHFSFQSHSRFHSDAVELFAAGQHGTIANSAMEANRSMALKVITLCILILPTGKLLKQRKLPKELENTLENILGEQENFIM